MICIDAEQLQDGLYNVKDGKIFKYKAKGGTARVYKVEYRPQGKWLEQHENGHGFWVGTCNQCGKEKRVDNFCSNCGARMKGADDATD